MAESTCKHARRVKASALKASRKLDEATKAMCDFMYACHAAGHPDDHGIADSRRLLIESMQEYSGHLDSVFNKP